MDQFTAWLKTRPQKIQELTKQYPPGNYIIKKNNTPYFKTIQEC